MGTNPNNARFVPPPPDYLTFAMSDLEKYFYSYPSIPVLIKIGLIHAQFETIHPFTDGNGRTGRLLITLYLCQRKNYWKGRYYIFPNILKRIEIFILISWMNIGKEMFYRGWNFFWKVLEKLRKKLLKLRIKLLNYVKQINKR